MSALPQARGRVVVRVARLCDRDSVDAVITAWDPHRFAHLPAELFPGDDPAALVGRRFLADVNVDATDTDGLDVTNLGPAPDVPGEWLPAAGVVERAAEVLYEDWRQGDGTAPNRRATLRPWAEIRSRKYWLRGPRALAAAGLLRDDEPLPAQLLYALDRANRSQAAIRRVLDLCEGEQQVSTLAVFDALREPARPALLAATRVRNPAAATVPLYEDDGSAITAVLNPDRQETHDA